MVQSLKLEWSGCMKYKMDKDDDDIFIEILLLRYFYLFSDFVLIETVTWTGQGDHLILFPLT